MAGQRRDPSLTPRLLSIVPSRHSSDEEVHSGRAWARRVEDDPWDPLILTLGKLNHHLASSPLPTSACVSLSPGPCSLGETSSPQGFQPWALAIDLGALSLQLWFES